MTNRKNERCFDRTAFLGSGDLYQGRRCEPGLKPVQQEVDICAAGVASLSFIRSVDTEGGRTWVRTQGDSGGKEGRRARFLGPHS